jgi:hypothetical protein
MPPSPRVLRHGVEPGVDAIALDVSVQRTTWSAHRIDHDAILVADSLPALHEFGRQRVQQDVVRRRHSALEGARREHATVERDDLGEALEREALQLTVADLVRSLVQREQERDDLLDGRVASCRAHSTRRPL